MSRPRILSLLPSATEIVGALGLADCIVGVTHECDQCPDTLGMQRLIARGVARVTRSDLDPATMSQSAIDAQVKRSVSQGWSLYDVEEEALRRVEPTLVITQALCSVCGPEYGNVRQICQRLGAALADTGGREPAIVNLEPARLSEVAESFVTVADAAGAHERGVALKHRFESVLHRLAELTRPFPKPSVLLLEWLDPPFNAGHWVPEQIEAAGGLPLTAIAGGKSRQLSWEEIKTADPDVIVVACCGFDLERNRRDLEALLSPQNLSVAARCFRELRAVKARRVTALDGNRFYARPAPSLAEGALILAQVIHPTTAPLTQALKQLELPEAAWALPAPHSPPPLSSPASSPHFSELHSLACDAGEPSYRDPDTGYRVFTRLALERRGRCCGCGCRHCPYGHVNVKDKAARIQEPAFLHRREPPNAARLARKVLFWSGGKDSLLALRAWLRAERAKGKHTPEQLLDQLVLMTTFEANSRQVAHQEVSIASVQRQAEALNLNLVGVPLHSGVAYLERIAQGLEFVVRDAGPLDALIFGDLHLEHVRHWRDSTLTRFGTPLVYPLWQVDQQVLLDDLSASQVPCVLSACPGTEQHPSAEGVGLGQVFTAQLAARARAAGWDAFGENGEFHSLAQVWLVEPNLALGL